LPGSKINIQEDSAALAERIARITLEKKAEDVVIMNLAPLTSMTDFFVVCTGSTNTQVNTQVKAISEHVTVELKKEKIRPLHIESSSNQEWILVDYIDVVLHIFQPDKRRFYSLERLWGDAEIEEVLDS
jgi:ribosome-associated protein